MRNIIVVGAGVSGLAAAMSASSLKAEVTVFESEYSIPPQKSLLPYLISGELKEEMLIQSESLISEVGIEFRRGEPVISIDADKREVKTKNGSHNFDSLVLATGTISAVDPINGLSKNGVYLMKGIEDYLRLGKLKDASRIAILGSTPLALTVAEMLVHKGFKTMLFSPFLLSGYVSPAIKQLVIRRIEEGGVEVIQHGVERVAGVEKVEAVISNNFIYPCDVFVVFPRYVPQVPKINLEKGNAGGILVDMMMRTSIQDIFAAGDCTELRFKASSVPIRLHSSSRIMGEVAGANAAGRKEKANLSGALSQVIFGLELCSAGLTIETAKMMGIDAVDANIIAKANETITSSIVFDKNSREVYGIQLAGWNALSYSNAISVISSLNIKINDLAYLEFPYFPPLYGDESPITLSARKAMSLVGH
jgi:NADPH-dependent 2,4-dienoyl-CoA reductase/sulfur reductase-like enzyme